MLRLKLRIANWFLELAMRILVTELKSNDPNRYMSSTARIKGYKMSWKITACEVIERQLNDKSS